MSKLYRPEEGTVSALNGAGDGVVEREGKRPVFVPDTLPGERIQFVPRRRVKAALEADLLELLEASPDRVKPICPYASVCGGCSWQHVDGALQVKTKELLVNEAFAGAGLDLTVSEFIPCPEPFYYRNRMDYAFGRDGELGLKMSGRWWETLDLETCFLLSKEAPEILRRVREWSQATELPFWDTRDHQGFFRYLVIREGKNTGERLIMLVTSDQVSPDVLKEHKKSLVVLLDDLATSILWSVNDKVTDLSTPSSMEVLKGTPFLHESVNEITYRIQPASFFQTNTIMAAKLQDVVLNACEGNKGLVMDLYCGAGFFSLQLAKRGVDVLGVELDAAAIEGAKENARLNTINNAEFIASKAEEFDWLDRMPEIVIVDPPRAGLHPDVIAALTKALPTRIIYVSCKYQRLIEELPHFLKHYSVKKVSALDLFPQTPHVEVVVEMTKL
ncbi:MAG: 23S rRNA (uracil(1939)-C(5))-methyltransferase RlmD [Patescibacteria group bacterium]